MTPAAAAFLAAPERSVMTTGDVAALLGVHRKTVTAWAASGKLRSWRTPGGHYRYQRADAICLLPAAGPYGNPGAIRNGGGWHPNAPRPRPRHHPKPGLEAARPGPVRPQDRPAARHLRARRPLPPAPRQAAGPACRSVPHAAGERVWPDAQPLVKEPR